MVALALEPSETHDVDGAEREAGSQQQPAAVTAGGAACAYEPFCLCLAQALLVALTGEEAERVWVVWVHCPSLSGLSLIAAFSRISS